MSDASGHEPESAGTTEDRAGTPTGQDAPDPRGRIAAWMRERVHLTDPRLRRRLQVGASLAVIVGLIAAGGSTGWWLRGRQIDKQLRPVVVNVAAGTATTVPSDRPMPSLAGLSEGDARAALAFIGVTGSAVTVTPTAAAGPGGVVVGQDPPPGATVKAGAAVTLKISAPATVPDVVGKTETEARAALSALGARVQRKETFDPNAAQGAVLAIEPAAGAPLTDEVTITVAEAPSSVFLTELKPVKTNCSTGTATVKGSDVKSALTCGPSANAASPAVVDYAVNGSVTRFDATFGQSDRAETRFSVQFQTFVDDQLVDTQTVAFGQTVDISIPISGALRVRVEMVVAADPKSCCGSGVRAVLANARFVGAPDAIDALVASTHA
ncbi:MAG: eukaryotic-like serine/threonine-protein kinase [Acidimicrobiaceae bacterium]|jgi:hypothetical protein